MNFVRRAVAITTAGILSLSAAQANHNSSGGSKTSRGKHSVSTRHSAKARTEARRRKAKIDKSKREDETAAPAVEMNESAELPRRDEDDNDVQDDEIGSGSLMGTVTNEADNGGGRD